MIPKVIFKVADYESNYDVVKNIYLGESDTLDFNKYITDLFPSLKDIDETTSKEERLKILKDEFDREWNESMHLFEEDVKRFTDIWESLNDIYMNTLSNYLNIKWPDNHPIITAEIGLFPIFPRYVEDFRFCIYPGLTSDRLINVVSHEVLHFLWFYKWKSMYPGYVISDSAPHDNIWKYSEVVVDPILNSEKIKSVLNIDLEMKTYDVFYDMMHDEDSNVVEHLKSIYQENISIEEKIEKGYLYFNEMLNKKSL